MTKGCPLDGMHIPASFSKATGERRAGARLPALEKHWRSTGPGRAGWL